MPGSRTVKYFIAVVVPLIIQAQWNYPLTRVETVIDELHGTRISDDYRWLENSGDPEVQDWITAQDDFTHFLLDSLPQRRRIEKIVSALYDMPVMTVPQIYDQRYFYFKRAAGQNHKALYYSDDFPGRKERVALDPNQFSEAGTTGLDWQYPSPSGALLAYGASRGGSEISTLMVRNVDQGADLALVIPYTRSSPVVWLPDESGFYYVRYPEPGTVAEGDEFYFRRLFFHDLADTTWENDCLIFGDQLGREDWVDAYGTSDGEYLFIYSSVDWTVNDLYLMRLERNAEIQPVAVGLDGYFSGDVYDDRIYLLTDLNAPQYRLVTAPVGTPGPEYWKEIIPASNQRLETFTIADGQIAVAFRKDVISHLWMYSLDGKRKWEIPLPVMGSIKNIHGDPRSYNLFFDFESFIHPPTIFHFDLFTDKLQTLHRPEPGIDLSHQTMTQIFYPSRDGTSIPMFIVHHDSLELTGDNPTMLYGYGGFDISEKPVFSQTAVPWILEGGVFALANIRGGGEYGRAWHESARLDNKQNSYDDFIAAGEWLIANGYTDSKHLSIRGGSNGGLLVGVAITQRPDLWQAAVCGVPLLDMIRYHKFSIASLWIPEFGSADNPQQFPFIFAYSPYHNVKSHSDYPATLFTTSEFDTRVDPLHACKMTALLQKKNTGQRPILLRYERSAGHSKGTPVSKSITTRSDELAFLMWQLGMK
ncbi:MAG: prolyl oligopeptidase family serine peptidase [Candidatus Neomarinimicrobiota bacterium]